MQKAHKPEHASYYAADNQDTAHRCSNQLGESPSTSIQ